MAADRLHDPAIALLREPPPPELGRGRHPQHAQPRQAVDDAPGDVRLAVDRRRVDARLGELPEGGHGLLHLGALRGGELRVGEEHVAPEVAAEERLGEPPRRRLREEQLLRLADLACPLGIIRRRGIGAVVGDCGHD